jgi:hypothetical protein
MGLIHEKKLEAENLMLCMYCTVPFSTSVYEASSFLLNFVIFGQVLLSLANHTHLLLEIFLYV